jgi:hypothetical protein
MNPITAVVKGTQNTVDQARKNVAQAAKSAMPSPSEAVYNLGMGIGPLLRNIASEMKKEQDKDKKDKKDTTNPANPKSGLVGKKEFSALTTQIGSMITVLKDIREIGRMQLRADQQRLFEARRQQYLGKEAEQESGLLEKPSAAGSGKGGTGSGLLGALGSISDMVPGLLKLVAAGFAGKWVWDNVFDEKTRKMIKDRLTSLVGDLGEKLADSMWTAYKDAFESAPITTALTTAATAYLAARITGLAAGMGLVFKGGKWVGDQMVDKPPPSKVNPKGSTAVGLESGAAAAMTAEEQIAQRLAAQTAQAAGVRQSTVDTKGMSKAERIKYERAARAERAAIRQEIEALEKAKISAGPPFKPGGGTTWGTKFARGLGVLGGGLSLYGGYENWQDDKKWSAGLYGLSGTLGLSAVGAGMTGVGAPAAPWLAAGSAVTGVAGLGVDWLETWMQNRDNQKRQEEIDKRLGELKKAEVAASMKSNEGRSSDSGRFDTKDYEKYREGIGYRENGGKYSGSNTLGYLGKYQFGVAALEDLGYIKKGSAKKLGDNKNQDIIFKDPKNWTDGWSKEKFLNDKKAQDDAMQRFTSNNLAWLRKNGYLKSESTTQQISGLLAAMHIGGPGGVIKMMKENIDRQDAYGTKVSDYIKYGEQIFAQNAEDNKGFQDAWKTAINKMTPSSTLSASNVVGPDQKMANELAEMTETIANYMKAATSGVMYNSVDQSSKVNVIQEGSSGGSSVTDINPANIKEAVQSAVGK